MRNLQRSGHGQRVIDRARNDFARIVYASPSIHGPSQEAVAEMDVAERRRDPEIETMAAAFDVQPKDVPVVVFAHRCYRESGGQQTTIYTADREFGQFDPTDRFEALAMNYVDCSEEHHGT